MKLFPREEEAISRNPKAGEKNEWTPLGYPSFLQGSKQGGSGEEEETGLLEGPLPTVTLGFGFPWRGEGVLLPAEG
jgi:hypothetical protein